MQEDIIIVLTLITTKLIKHYRHIINIFMDLLATMTMVTVLISINFTNKDSIPTKDVAISTVSINMNSKRRKNINKVKLEHKTKKNLISFY